MDDVLAARAKTRGRREVEVEVYLRSNESNCPLFTSHSRQRQPSKIKNAKHRKKNLKRRETLL